MKKYFFTFGFDHYDIHDFSMWGYYVTVIASSYDLARTTFIEKFMKVYMKNTEDHNWQFSEDSFNPSLYSGGNAMTIFEI